MTINHKHTPVARRLAATTTLLAAAGAHAAITGISTTTVDFSNGYVLEDGSIAPGTQDTVSAAWTSFRNNWGVCRLWATVDSADSTVGGVGGSVDMSADFSLTVNDSGVFYNSEFGGDTAAFINPMLMADQASAHLAFDTFITIGTATNTGPQVSMVDPNNALGGFAGSVECQNCGWTVTPMAGLGVVENPTGASSHRVLLGQFTIPRGDSLSGQVRIAGGGQDLVIPFPHLGPPHAAVPAPGAMALFGVAVILSQRRRRR